MNRKKSYLNFCALAGFILLTGCASAKPESKLTPQQLIMQNRKAEAKQEFVMPTDINAADEDGNTVLHIAAKIDDEELVTYFIFKGADPELKNFEGDTPLHVAIKNHSMRAAKALSAVSSTLFSRDSEGITAKVEKGILVVNIKKDKKSNRKIEIG